MESSVPQELRLAESAQGSRDFSSRGPALPGSTSGGDRNKTQPRVRTPGFLPGLGLGGESSNSASVSGPTPPNGGGSSPTGPIVEEETNGTWQPIGRTAAQDDPDRERILRRAARFKDTRIPLEQREAEIRALAKRGDDESIRVLIAVADQYIYLNRAAVEALGSVPEPEVVAYLVSKLSDVDTHDVTFLCECIRSAGKLLGDDAVKEVANTMKAARARDDGHSGPIREVCIRTLGKLGRPEAVSPLKEELEHICAKDRLDLAHGSEIVKAYAEIGDRRAADILAGYADFLEKTTPDEPMPRRYYEEKIREARDIARQLSANTVAQALTR